MNRSKVPVGLRVEQNSYTGGGKNTMSYINAGVVSTTLFDKLYNNVIVGGEAKTNHVAKRTAKSTRRRKKRNKGIRKRKRTRRTH